MNENAFKDAYRLFISKGYRGSAEEFKQLIESNRQAFEDSYKLFKTGGYTGNEDAYSTLLGVKPPDVEISSEKKNEKEQDGSVGSEVDISEFEMKDERPEVVAESTGVNNQKIISPLDIAKANERREEFEANQAKLTKERQEEEQKRRDEVNAAREQQKIILNQDADFLSTVDQITPELIGLDDNTESQTQINNLIGKYGFNTRRGFGSITVSTSTGDASIEIDLDPFTGKGEIDEADKLKQFIKNNANPSNEMKHLDYLGNAHHARNSRTAARVNEDGSESSHLMTSFEQDGKFYAVPTLFPKDPSIQSSYSDRWVQFDELSDAIKMGEDRGEIYAFDTKEEAEDFAEGGWKNVDMVDFEAHKYFADRGLNYTTYKQTLDEYERLRDEIDVIDSQTNYDDLSEEDQKKYGHLYINKVFRDDIEEYQDVIEERKDELFDYVKGDDVLDSSLIGDVFGFGTSREDIQDGLDLHLQKIFEEKKEEAVEVNNIAKKAMDDVVVASLNDFGVKPEQLPSIAFEDEASLNRAKEIMTAYYQVKNIEKIAAAKYYNARTYFDKKQNKDIIKEYNGNLEGFGRNITDGLKQGNAAEEILKFSMGMGDETDMDKLQTATAIVDFLGTQSGTETAVAARYRRAVGFDETWDAMSSNPAEWALGLAANSMSMMLPYGYKIVGMSTASGIATGAAIGSTGFVTGPGGVVTTKGGALLGGMYGFRTGMAATSFAMEYTNSILETMAEKGYDMTNPQSVLKGLEDPEVWSEGGKKGRARGIPIAIVDYFTAGLAGRILAPAGKVGTSFIRRQAGNVAERLIIDPIGEGLGEVAAQTSEMGFGTGRQTFDWKEITAEMGGGIGSNTSNMAINLFVDANIQSNISLANDFTNIEFLSKDNSKAEKVSNWSQNMYDLGNIDADTNQRIQENIGLQRDAENILGKNPKRKLQTRVMQLLEAKKQLGDTKENKKIHAKKIADINQEISDIANNKKLADTPVDISGIVKKAETTSTFKINGRRYTESDFRNKLENMSEKQRAKAKVDIIVLNDNKKAEDVTNFVNNLIPESNKNNVKIKEESNANTKSSPTTLPNEVQAEDGQAVDAGVPGQPETTTKEGKEEVVEITDEQVIERIKKEKQGSDVYTQEEFDNMKAVMVKEQADATDTETEVKVEQEVEVENLTDEEKTEADRFRNALGFPTPDKAVGNKTSRGKREEDITPKEEQTLIRRLKKAFPSVSVSTNEKTFERAMNKPNVRKEVRDGQTVYGITEEGKVILNPNLKNTNTPIHEFGHVWLNTLKKGTAKAKALYRQGMSLVTGTQAFENAKEKYGKFDNNGNLTNENKVKEEALATLIGDKGSSILNEQKKQKFKNWLQKAFAYIKENLKGLSDIKQKEIKNLSVDQFTDAAVKDILGGTQISPEADTDTGVQLQQRAEGLDANQIVDIGRRQGVNEKIIKSILKEQGFDAKAINEALAQKFDSRNVNLAKEFGSVRNLARVAARTKKGIKDVQDQLRAYIRKNLPASKQYSQAKINRLLTQVANANTITKLNKALDAVDKVVQEQRKIIKRGIIKDIQKLVNSKAKTRKTRKGVVKSKGLDAQGQAFFAEAKNVLKAVLEGDVETLSKLEEKYNSKEYQDALNKKENRTRKEQSLVDQMTAFDSFRELLDNDVEFAQEVLNDLKDTRKESRIKMAENRATRAEQKQQTQEETTEAIKKDGKYSEAFDEDGNVISQTKAQDNKNKREVQYLRGGIYGTFQKLANEVGEFANNPYDYISSLVKNYMLHLKSLSVGLDSKNSTYFVDNIYKPLNRMDEAQRKGYAEQQKKLDEIGRDAGYEDGKKGFENDINNDPIQVIDGIKDVDSGNFTKNQLLRIYALSKNAVQRAKLEAQGFTAEKLAEVEKILGPKAIKYADGVIDYLSNEYYESINSVYKSENDINLGYVDNYFPTKTIVRKEAPKILENGDFSRIFSAETAPALKERTDVTGEVDVFANFTTALDSHFDTMEKYKTHAEGVRKMNNIFSTPAFQFILQDSGIEKVYRGLINTAINPDYMQRVAQGTSEFTKLYGKFTSWALSFKLVQIIKQATSFVNAYGDYTLRKGKATPVLDAIGFSLDLANVIIRLPADLFGKGPIHKMMEKSETFRNRITKGLEGDVYGLESGREGIKEVKNRSGIKKAIEKIRIAGSQPTILGDILGITGYIANYNRDIANGMSEEKALEKFNDYNATQQSRRAADKIPLQALNQNEFTKMVTMFTSQLFLQFNEVVANIQLLTRELAKGKKASSTKLIQSSRKVALNYGIANALFIATSNIAMLLKGDKEDEENYWMKVKDGLKGLTLLESVPLIGFAVRELEDNRRRAVISNLRQKIKETNNPQEKKRLERELKGLPKASPYGTKDGVNPFTRIVNELYKLKDDEVQDAVIKALGISMGANFDPMIGMYNYFKGGDAEQMDDAVYDFFGISPSYRPQNKEKKRKQAEREKPLSKTDINNLKKRNPALWKKRYGPGTAYYKRQQKLKEQREKQRRRRR